MAKKSNERREFLQIDAVDPLTGKSIGVQISHSRLMNVARRSMGQANEAAFIVPQTLQKPTAIFEGLRRDEDDDRRGVGWRCYCGSPSRSYRTDGSERPRWPGSVYLVFVNRDGIAYNWRWEKEDASCPGLPAGHGMRFKKRLL